MPNAPTTDVCWLPSRAQIDLLDFARDWHPNEVGGILAGYVNGKAIVVTEVVGPGPNATHERILFCPDHEYHLQEMSRIYQASNGEHTYLGDWHTHPDGPSVLSPLDKKTLRAIARAPEAQCPQPLMLLLSGGPEDWKFNASRLDLPRRFRSRRVADVSINFYEG